MEPDDELLSELMEFNPTQTIEHAIDALATHVSTIQDLLVASVDASTITDAVIAALRLAIDGPD